MAPMTSAADISSNFLSEPAAALLWPSLRWTGPVSLLLAFVVCNFARPSIIGRTAPPPVGITKEYKLENQLLVLEKFVKRLRFWMRF